eukprot:scaffold4160_cov130-Isochrysis_galbana.AAC.2
MGKPAAAAIRSRTVAAMSSGPVSSADRYVGRKDTWMRRYGEASSRAKWSPRLERKAAELK